MAGGRVRYTEQEAREAVAASRSYAETLRRLGMRPAGGNHATIKRYVERVWRIPTDHFDPHAASRAALRTRKPRPLGEILVEHSTYSRTNLKARLYKEGIKRPICELCGQGEIWLGRRMSLILDHINGRATDNRLENLRIVCPNCAATFETHCGKMLRRIRTERPCGDCGSVFYPTNDDQRFCSHPCWARSNEGQPRAHRRRVERPPYDQLMRELAESNFSAIGRRYGVSDNAIRKWVSQYERERAAEQTAQAALGDEPGLAA